LDNDLLWITKVITTRDNFSPYLDDSDLSELPWITNLIKAYNDIARSLPSPWDLQYEPIEF
jgi:hypothetical protein